MFTTSIHPKLHESCDLHDLCRPQCGWVNGCVPAATSMAFLPGPRQLVCRCLNTLLDEDFAIPVKILSSYSNSEPLDACNKLFYSSSFYVIILLRKPSAANTRLYNWLGWVYPLYAAKDKIPPWALTNGWDFYFLL